MRGERCKNIFSFFFAFLIFAFCFVFFSPVPSANAQVSTASAVSGVDYQLAYPGLLPDHPLYFLKAARERLMSIFISDPLKKAKFNLLQSDKRTEASYMLSQKGQKKMDFAQSTFSKAENYFDQALKSAKEAKMQGMEITELVKKFQDSNAKHKEVLQDIVRKLTPGQKKKFSVEGERLIEFDKRINELARKK